MNLFCVVHAKNKLEVSLVISPFYFLFAIYIFANAFAAAHAVLTGGIVVEGQRFLFSVDTIVLAFVVQFFCAASLLGLSKLFCGCSSRSNLVFGKQVGLLVLVFQVLFFVYNWLYGVNVAGSSVEYEGPQLLKLAFVALQPDTLFLVVAAALKGPALFWLNAIVYLLSTLARGWMGGIFLLAVLLLSRHFPVNITYSRFFTLALCFVATVACLPLLVEAKWLVRSGGSMLDVFGNVLEFGYWDYLGYSFWYLLNRFQHVGHVALLVENSRLMNQAYEMGAFDSYWLDGLPQHALLKLFGGDLHRVNTFMVEEFFGAIDAGWNTNPGLAGWVFILRERSIFFVFYILSVVLIPFYVVARWGGLRLLLVLASFSLIYLFHGWIGAYFNFALYMMVFVVAMRIRFFSNSDGIRKGVKRLVDSG